MQVSSAQESSRRLPSHHQDSKSFGFPSTSSFHTKLMHRHRPSGRSASASHQIYISQLMISQAREARSFISCFKESRQSCPGPGLAFDPSACSTYWSDRTSQLPCTPTSASPKTGQSSWKLRGKLLIVGEMVRGSGPTMEAMSHLGRGSKLGTASKSNGAAVEEVVTSSSFCWISSSIHVKTDLVLVVVYNNVAVPG